MARFLPFLLLALTLITPACAKDSQEKIAQDSAATMKELGEVLSGIQDQATAEQAKPKLEAIAERTRALEARMLELGTPDPALAKELGEKAGMTEAIGIVIQQTQRLAQTPELMAVIQPVMREMGTLGN